MVEPAPFNLLVGWTSMVAGTISGAAIGLFFHSENWLGGFASLRRRMLRLGHIAFFGLGIVNVLFALSAAALALPRSYGRFAAVSFAVAALTMPTCCFLTAWQPRFRLFFPIPVMAMLCGLAGLLGGAFLR